MLAIGIVIQGLVFAGVQGLGLTSLFATGCGLIAQFMWPGACWTIFGEVKANNSSTVHRAIYSIGIRYGMRNTISSKYAISSEGEMGCDYLLWGSGGYANPHLDTVECSA